MMGLGDPGLVCSDRIAGISELRALKEDVLVPRLVSQATSDCTLEQMLFPGEVVALL